MVARQPRPAIEMMAGPASVLRWPASFDAAQERLIVAVDTPDTPIRETARQQVRDVLREILGDVELISRPGQPIRVAGQVKTPGISVSHEAGLSLVAVHFGGPVGIDLLRMPEYPDWRAELLTLAVDYLGPIIARQIAALPPIEQLACFASAWTRHEARLKCLGLGLEEWSDLLENRLAPCRVQTLILPSGYIGAVATLTAAENPAA